MATLWYHYFLLQVYQLPKVRHTVISPLVWLLCSYTVYRKLMSTCSALYYHLAILDEFHIQLLLLYMDVPFFYSYAVFGGGFQFFFAKYSKCYALSVCLPCKCIKFYCIG